jgi:mRNA interferase MazF
MQTSSSRPVRERRPSFGELWYVDFGESVGHEQSYRWPALVVSDDPFNRSRYGLHVVVPLTKQEKRFPTHVPIRPPDANLAVVSYVKCEDIRSVSLDRFGRYVGAVSTPVLQVVQHRLRILLRL